LLKATDGTPALTGSGGVDLIGGKFTITWSNKVLHWPNINILHGWKVVFNKQNMKERNYMC
jgi:hypothetical protein